MNSRNEINSKHKKHAENDPRHIIIKLLKTSDKKKILEFLFCLSGNKPN